MNHIELLKVLFTGLRSPAGVGGPGGCFWGDHRGKEIGGAVGGCCSKGELQEGCYAQGEDDATPSNPAEVVFLCAWVPIRFTTVLWSLQHWPLLIQDLLFVSPYYEHTNLAFYLLTLKIS